MTNQQRDNTIYDIIIIILTNKVVVEEHNTPPRRITPAGRGGVRTCRGSALLLLIYLYLL